MEVVGFCWRWRKSWKRGFKLGGVRGGVAAEGWVSWKKGLEPGGGLGRRRGSASFSAIEAETRSRK